MLYSKSRLAVLCVVVNIFLYTSTVEAQQFWVDDTESHSISIEYLKPGFGEIEPVLGPSYEYTFLSSSWFFSGKIQVSERLALFGEFPVTYAEPDFDLTDIDDLFFDESDFEDEEVPETILGNPRLGILYGDRDSPRLELSLRFPVAPDDKPFVSNFGTLSDFDRVEAYAPDHLSIAGRMHRKYYASDNFLIKFKTGAKYLVPTNNTDELDSELWLDYGVIGGISQDSFRMLGGITGVIIDLFEDFEESSDRYVHHFGINASFPGGALTPGFHVRLPIQNEIVTDDLDYVIGLNVVYNIGT